MKSVPQSAIVNVFERAKVWYKLNYELLAGKLAVVCN